MILDSNFILDHSIEELVELSRGTSKLADIEREGIVIRPLKETKDIETGRCSIKVINPYFLLKHGD